MADITDPLGSPENPYILRGDGRKSFSCTDHEYILSGAADTGKTVACCLKAHTICTTIPKAQGLICRKTSASLTGSVTKTFLRIVDHYIQNGFVRVYGGETPSRFIYGNGSTIWLGGMDSESAVLSAERDFIYVNQAEELVLSEWETLATRCSGRAAVIATPQLFGDCNPGSQNHWIRTRSQQLKQNGQPKLRLFVATHRDNPTIYDDSGNLVPGGEERLDVLRNLSGVRRKRLMEGIWATAEGAVYDFDPNFHVCVRDPKEMKVWYLAMDEGFTHPAVILLVGADSDRRWHIFREFYKRGVVPEDVVAEAAAWNKEKLCECAAVDEAAAGLIASLQAAGVNAMPGKGRILDGIARIQNRLKIQKGDTSGGYKDGRPRLTVDPGCVNTVNEFESYRWKPEKDVPLDESNHSLDSVRYLDDVVTEGTGAFNENSAIVPPQGSGARFVSGRTFTPRSL